MSNNKNTIYIFVKGNKGRGAYAITNANGDMLHEGVISNLIDEEKTELSPTHADRKIIIKSLEYIRDNRGKNNLPQNPIVFIFTTFENNYHLAAQIKKPEKDTSKKFLEELKKLQRQLVRISQDTEKDDNIKFHYIPDNFENKIDHVNELLGKVNKRNKNR